MCNKNIENIENMYVDHIFMSCFKYHKSPYTLLRFFIRNNIIGKMFYYNDAYIFYNLMSQAFIRRGTMFSKLTSGTMGLFIYQF